VRDSCQAYIVERSVRRAISPERQIAEAISRMSPAASPPLPAFFFASRHFAPSPLSSSLFLPRLGHACLPAAGSVCMPVAACRPSFSAKRRMPFSPSSMRFGGENESSAPTPHSARRQISPIMVIVTIFRSPRRRCRSRCFSSFACSLMRRAATAVLNGVEYDTSRAPTAAFTPSSVFL